MFLTLELLGYVDGNQCIFEGVDFGGQVSHEYIVKLNEVGTLVESFLLGVCSHLISELMPQSIQQ